MEELRALRSTLALLSLYRESLSSILPLAFQPEMLMSQILIFH
jgi:hypothetical protein